MFACAKWRNGAWHPAFRVSEALGETTYIHPQSFTTKLMADHRAAELVDGLLLELMTKAINSGFELEVEEHA